MIQILIDKNDITVILPAFNEGSMIEEVIDSIRIEGYRNILVIDDGSSDNTAELAMKSGASAIKFCINRGVGAATRAGILAARSQGLKYIVFIDADGQHFPADIDKLVASMSQTNADLVIGSRFLEQKSDIPGRRVFYNKIANLFTYFGQSKISDSQSGFRLLNKKVIDNLDLELDDYGVCTEMIWKCRNLDCKISEAPIRVVYTDYSMSKGQGFLRGIETGFSLLIKRIT